MILLAVKPLIGITTSELRPGGLRTLQRHGEPPIPEMALGMTYVQAIEAAGGIPVVVPALVIGTFLGCSLASTGSFSQEGRTSPPRPTGPGLTCSSA